jgi:5'-3' exonuclease
MTTMSSVNILDSIVSQSSNPVVIFIDGSYFCFHRYYSIMRWWKSAFPDDPIIDPMTRDNFVEKFKSTFVDNIRDIPKRLGLHKLVDPPIMMVGKDCPRDKIWRNELQANYKGTRKTDFMGGPLFKSVHEEKLFEKGGVSSILSCPQLEADDCIALSVKYVASRYPQVNIFIITSDKDYLQLAKGNVQIYDLGFKNLALQKSSNGNAEMDLFCKIIMGDISDNIPSVLHKCGPKTAIKCFNDRAYFEERLKKENAYDKYETNCKMVDFNYIPENLAIEFFEKIKI